MGTKYVSYSYVLPRLPFLSQTKQIVQMFATQTKGYEICPSQQLPLDTTGNL